MREELLGYLLGALDTVEHERVEQQLEANRELQSELSTLQNHLDCLAPTYGNCDPPVGLADRTCATVLNHVSENHVTPARHVMRTQIEMGSSRHFSPADFLVAAAVILAAALLFFPAISNSRASAERAMCENNLRQLGIALTAYSDFSRDKSFPYISPTGNYGFAGAVAPILMNFGGISDDRIFLCAAEADPDDYRTWKVPTLVELRDIDGTRQVRIRARALGSYGYNIGVIENGQHRAPRNQGRSHFAILADAPSTNLVELRTANHGGRGQNVLYEDGHVRFIAGCPAELCNDHPYKSNRNRIEPGQNIQDAVIGRSETVPQIVYTRGP